MPPHQTMRTNMLHIRRFALLSCLFTHVYACKSSPTAVAEKLQSAIARNNIEDAMRCIDDKAVFSFSNGTSVASAAAIKTALLRKFASGYRVEHSTPPVLHKNGTVVWTVTAHDDLSMQLGLAALDRRIEASIKNGKVVSLKALLTQESENTLKEAQYAQASQIFQQWLRGINEGHSQAALSRMSLKPSWVWALSPAERYESIPAIASHLKALAEQHFTLTPTQAPVLHENVFSVPCVLKRDDWQDAGLDQGTGTVSLTLDHEQIVAVMLELDEETRAVLNPAAPSSAPAEAPATTESKGP